VLGDGVDDDSTRTMSAVVFDSTGQVELRLPRMLAEAWGSTASTWSGPTLRPFGVAPTLT